MIPNAGDNAKKPDHSDCWWECNMAQSHWTTTDSFSLNEMCTYDVTQQFHFWSFISEQQKVTSMNFHNSFIHNRPKLEVT